MSNVLVLGNDTRSFLASIRSLGRYNLKVYIAECNRVDIRSSRYVFDIVDLGDFENDPIKWCKSLEQFLKKVKIKFILPVDDPSTLKLKYYEELLGVLPSLFLPNDDAKKITDDKELSTDLAKSLNIPVAETRIGTSINDVETSILDYGFPIVVKPHESFLYGNQKEKDKVLVIENDDEFNDSKKIIANYLKRYKSVIIQKYFEGIGTGIEILANEGKILTAFQHIRVHEPKKGGGSSLRKSISLDKKMYGDVERIVESLRYSGVMMVEFKYNTVTKEYVFIEINSRLWGSLPLSITSGIDFPVYLYQLHIEGKQQFNREYKVGVYQRNFEADLGWKILLLKRKKIFVFLREYIFQFIRIITHREFVDEKIQDDKIVYKITKRELVKRIISAIKRKLLRKHLMISAKRPKRLVTSEDNILFVCYGNICRSAFADCYRCKFVNDSHTKSAGYIDKEGRILNKDIKKIADSLNVDSSRFLSHKLTEQMVQWADYIFCFDDKNYQFLLLNYKKYMSKVYLLGAFDKEDAGTPIIEDPYDLDENSKKEIILRIARIIDKYLVD